MDEVVFREDRLDFIKKGKRFFIFCSDLERKRFCFNLELEFGFEVFSLDYFGFLVKNGVVVEVSLVKEENLR